MLFVSGEEAMKKNVLLVAIGFLLLFIGLSGCSEDEIIGEVLNSGGQEYIVVAVDANVRVNGDPDLWDPIPGVPVTVNICKAQGEFYEEIKVTGDNGETGVVHASFNVYREQPVYCTATYYGDMTVSKTETLTWETIEAGANEVGMYSWNPMVILVVEDL
jgi:hypothetical protein